MKSSTRVLYSEELVACLTQPEGAPGTIQMTCSGECESPDSQPGPKKKHPCPDCHFCQFCSDSRCNPCRATGKKPRKLSMAEQIELFEELNRKG